MNEELKNIQKLAKMLDNQQLISHEDLAGVLTDIVNAFSQHRAASKQINLEGKETLNTLIKQLQAEHTRITGDVDSKTSETKENVLNELAQTKKEIEELAQEVLAMKPENGADGLDGAPGKDGKDGSSDTRDQIIDKINAGGKLKLKASEISGLPEFTREIVREVGTVGQIATIYKPGNNVTFGVDNSGNTLINASVSGGGLTMYTQTPIGVIDGVNKTYTVTNSINGIFSFGLNGQFLHPFNGTNGDYTYTGSTITFNTALDASYAGLPFTLNYY